MSDSVSPSYKSVKQPPSFFRGIANGLFNPTSAADASSDDENGITENAEYIGNAMRGIVVFRLNCLKKEREKVFHINLYTGGITQYTGTRKKVFSCYDIQSVAIKTSESLVTVEMKKSMDVSTRQKKYRFDKEDDAALFKKYIEFYKEFGQLIRAAFDLVDRMGTRVITPPMLEAGLKSLDILATNDLINNMLTVNGGDGSIFDYHSFFHLFMECEVSSIRECFLEWIQQSQHLNENQTPISSSNIFETMPGEIKTSVVEKVRWMTISGKCTGLMPSYRGTLYITNYRVVLYASGVYENKETETYQSRYDVPSFFNVMTIPLNTIYRVQISQPRHAILIICKDYRHVRITLSLSNDHSMSAKATGLVQVIESVAFRSSNAATSKAVETFPGSQLFAFQYRRKYIGEGWSLSDIRKEYLRQGLVGDGKWKLIVNDDWSRVDSYPAYFMLPALMTEDEVSQAIAHRSKGRLPAITYRHPFTDAVMTRSAQPLVGITMKASDADMKLLNYYRLKGLPPGPSDFEVPTKFYIFDARRQIAATLNMAAGKGTEDASIYRNTDIIFCDIDNIHVMRNAASAFADCLLPGAFIPTTSKNNYNAIHLANGSTVINASNSGTSQKTMSSGQVSSVMEMIGSGSGYFSKLEDSGWLRYLRLILSASVMVAEKMHLEGASVLIHCSDGWDRTSQICGISQILLDPYYRTIEGFAVLIEKDWCAFGHKCQDRGGHGVDHNHGAEERSPVFLQFLDCVFQVLNQFPAFFEYNDFLLCFIADHFHSGLFGNFLGNSDNQRNSDLHVQELTRSIWSHVLDYRESFTNPSYRPLDRPLWPNCSLPRMTVWHRYFSRWDHEMHPNKSMGRLDEWYDDWGNGNEAKPSIEKSSYHFVGGGKFNPREASNVSLVDMVSGEDDNPTSSIDIESTLLEDD